MGVMDNINMIIDMVGNMILEPMKLELIPELGITYGEMIIAGFILIIGTMAGVAIAKNMIPGGKSE